MLQLYWAQKGDAVPCVQLVHPMSQFDSFVHPFLHYRLREIYTLLGGKPFKDSQARGKFVNKFLAVDLLGSIQFCHTEAA